MGTRQDFGSICVHGVYTESFHNVYQDSPIHSFSRFSMRFTALNPEPKFYAAPMRNPFGEDEVNRLKLVSLSEIEKAIATTLAGLTGDETSNSRMRVSIKSMEFTGTFGDNLKMSMEVYRDFSDVREALTSSEDEQKA